jgi:hypothetical protein
VLGRDAHQAVDGRRLSVISRFNTICVSEHPTGPEATNEL